MSVVARLAIAVCITGNEQMLNLFSLRNIKNSLKSGGSRFVAGNDLAHDFDSFPVLFGGSG